MATWEKPLNMLTLNTPKGCKYTHTDVLVLSHKLQRCSVPCTKLLLGLQQVCSLLDQHDMLPSLLDCVPYTLTANAGAGEAVCWG